jgi:neurofibromin 1
MEFEKYIDQKNNYLQESSIKIEEASDTTFSNVVLNNDSEKSIFKIGTKYVKILQKQTLLSQEGKRTMEIIHLTNIDKLITKDSEEIEFQFYQSETNKKTVLNIKSSNAMQLIQVINTNKIRLRNDMFIMANIKEKDIGVMKQEDIPGSMLNMCLLNLESASPKTRRAAYNLLVALEFQFKFPIIVLETKNMCVPHNTGDLVVGLIIK